MKKRNLENLSDEEFALLMKPIYPSNKEYWLEAYYVGIRPSIMKSMLDVFRDKDSEITRAMLMYYIYFDLDWYVNENNCYPLVTTYEHHAHFLGVDLEEYKDALCELFLSNLVEIRKVDENFVAMMPKSPSEYYDHLEHFPLPKEDLDKFSIAEELGLCEGLPFK